MKYHPRFNSVLVRLISQETTKGGLILPDSAQNNRRLAEVVEVGPGAYMDGSAERRPVDLEPGQIVMLGPDMEAYDPQQRRKPYESRKIEDTDLYLVMDEEVIATVDVEDGTEGLPSPEGVISA